jgi:NAD(P)H-hydrate repair Nnr-like enzyme with NAD(P)H-hydrate dehydratase domain
VADFERQYGVALYPGIFWNLPTSKNRAGRLLIVGGHKHEFHAVQAIYEIADATGTGYVQAALPDSLRPVIGGGEFGHFLPASASGSLGRAALGELIHLVGEYDGAVIGANLTNNAETGIMIESLVRQTEQRLVVTEDAIEILKFHPDLITGSPKVVVVTTMSGLFALANNHHLPIAIKPNRGVIGKIEIIKQLASISRCSYVVFDQEVIVASENKVSLTPLANSLSDNAAIAIGIAATFWLHQGGKSYESLTSAALVMQSVASDKFASTTSVTQKIRKSIMEQTEQSD